MFSNTLEYALKKSIGTFNEYLSTLHTYVGYTDTDLKNAFIQRYKKAIVAVPMGIKDLNFNNLKTFKIRDGILVELEFQKSLSWNGTGENWIESLNNVIKQCNLLDLKEYNISIYNLEETFDSKINAINNFKIK